MEDKEDLKKLEEQRRDVDEKMKARMREQGIEEMINTEVKKFSKSGHIIIPRTFVGKKALVFILNEEKIKESK